MSILDKIRSEGEGFETQQAVVTPVAEPVEGEVVDYKPEYKPAELNVQNIATTTAKSIQLTPQQRDMVNKAKNAIDFMDARTVQGLDDGINQQLNSFNTQMLQRAKVSDVADMSPLILDVVNKAKNMDPSILRNADGSSKGGLLGMFNKGKNTLQNYKMQFETVEKQFDHIVSLLEGDIEKQKQALINMDELYNINYQQYCDLKLLIIAAEEKLEEVHNVILPDLKIKAERDPDSYATQTYQQAVSGAHRLEKKLSDMHLLRLDCIQTAQIIHIIESNSLAQIDSTKQTINGAVQQWKRGVVIALTLRDQEAAAKRDKMVRDANNAMRVQNAKLLGEVSIKVAENNERGVIDYDTLEKVHVSLMGTMEAISKIQSDGRQRRFEERGKVVELENKMRQAVIANGNDQQKNMLAYTNSASQKAISSEIPKDRLSRL